jgi:hypothetical protein
MIKNNMDKNGSAAFSAMIISARRFLSIELFGPVGAEVVSDG